MSNIGHNNPPDPIDEALAPYGDAIAEAENWLDGEPVQTEDQMNAVDVLLKDVKAAAKSLDEARKLATAPLHKAWKDEVARWKPTEDDLARIAKGLAAAGETFKKKLREQKEAENRAAYEEAERKRAEAEAAAAQANAADIEAQREAQRLKDEAMQAEKAAQAANRDRVTGLRKVHRYEIEDHRAALHWIARNDKDAMTAFIEEYVSKNHKKVNIEGVKQWVDEEAF